MWSFNYFCSLGFLLNVHWNMKLPANRTHVEVARAPLKWFHSFHRQRCQKNKIWVQSSHQDREDKRGKNLQSAKFCRKARIWCLNTSDTLEISLPTFHGRFVLFSASVPRNFPRSCFVNLSLRIGMEKLQQHQTSPAQGNPQHLLSAQ